MPCVDGKSLVYAVKELPECPSLDAATMAKTPYMLILDEQSGEPVILKVKDLVVNKEHTAFGTTIDQHTNDLETLSENLSSLETSIDNTLDNITITIDNGIKTYKTIVDTKIKMLHIGANVDNIQYGSTNISSITKSVNDQGQTIYTATSDVPLAQAYDLSNNITMVNGELITMGLVSTSSTGFEFRLFNITTGQDVLEYGAPYAEYNNEWVDGDLYDGVDGLLMRLNIF